MPLYEIDGHRPHLGEGACIRADNTLISVGDRSNIQEGAMLHSDAGVPCSVGADVTVGHHAILHGCTIADLTLIGMGAIVLNHAVIPTGCIVGAGALVTEGKTFEANSLIVGSPARAIKTVDVAAMLKLSAAHYVAKAKQFAGELRRVD